MIKYFIVILVLIILLIIAGITIGLRLNNSNYFCNIIKDDCPEIKFFIKKHTIFRFFALGYLIIHYFLNIISVTTSFITVYMVMDDKTEINTQIFFLLTAAITTNLLLGLRLDKISETYAQAMRILENAILKYSIKEEEKILLYEANEKAEQLMGNKFF